MRDYLKQLTHPTSDISLNELITRTIVLFGGWLGLVVNNIQGIITALSGLAILFYTLSNTYVLWRDKILKKKKEAEETAAGELE